MDDVLTFYAKNNSWDHGKLLQSQQTDCYLPPLRLEPGADDIFLETQFSITHNRVSHWLKNENQLGAPPKIWRYAHFKCQSPFDQKRTTMMACLKKVHKMASDTYVLRRSALQKVAEFARLQYPRKMLWSACTTMGVQTRDAAWFRVRDQL